jgi:CheY-like chemotaxis protein
MTSRPILLIDDDQEDLEIFEEAFKSLDVDNEIVTFSNAELALEHLQTSSQQYLFILCDINMPRVNGLELRQAIYDDEILRQRSIPFLFFSTANDRIFVDKAYDLSVQGFFRKPFLQDELKDMLRAIITYWQYSYHPNSRKEHIITETIS